jgi:hypothetical protein
MGTGYQKRDFDIIDYHLYHIKGFDRPFRGPQIPELEKGNYLTCLGAAQTFGCYAVKPFPLLLQENLEIPVLNFGVAGAGPLFFLNNKNYLKKINDGKFAIVQVLSGRSENNSLFESNGREMLLRLSDQKRLGAGPAYQDLINNYDSDFIRKIVDETRTNWTINMISLLKRIHVPKILFWFSVREPDYEMEFTNAEKLFGDFPQLITKTMIDILIPLADDYVETISNIGLPQKLINRFTKEETFITKREDLSGTTKSVNDYYPSPEMHLLAYQSLSNVCRKYL